MPVYVVTGASRGLGFEWVRQVSQTAGNIVIATVRTASPIPPSLATLKQASPASIHVLSCDTSSSASITDFGNSIGSVLGPEGKIDYLINNAGMTTPPPHPNSLALEADDLMTHMNVNVAGPANVVAALLPFLRRGSVVVNISSALGSKSRTLKMPFTMHTAYSISKGALNMLSVHQAVDLRPHGIIVIALDPGWVKTDLTEGENPSMLPEQSVSGMLETVHQLTEKESGRFYTFSGRESPW